MSTSIMSIQQLDRCPMTAVGHNMLTDKCISFHWCRDCHHLLGAIIEIEKPNRDNSENDGPRSMIDRSSINK